MKQLVKYSLMMLLFYSNIAIVSAQSKTVRIEYNNPTTGTVNPIPGASAATVELWGAGGRGGMADPSACYTKCKETFVDTKVGLITIPLLDLSKAHHLPTDFFDMSLCPSGECGGQSGGGGGGAYTKANNIPLNAAYTIKVGRGGESWKWYAMHTPQNYDTGVGNWRDGFGHVYLLNTNKGRDFIEVGRNAPYLQFKDDGTVCPKNGQNSEFYKADGSIVANGGQAGENYRVDKHRGQAGAGGAAMQSSSVPSWATLVNSLAGKSGENPRYTGVWYSGGGGDAGDNSGRGGNGRAYVAGFDADDDGNLSVQSGGTFPGGGGGGTTSKVIPAIYGIGDGIIDGGKGAGGKAVIQFTVPQPVITANKTTITSTDPATLSVQNPIAGVTYEWYKNAAYIGTGTTFQVTGTLTLGTGSYLVKAVYNINATNYSKLTYEDPANISGKVIKYPSNSLLITQTDCYYLRYSNPGTYTFALPSCLKNISFELYGAGGGSGGVGWEGNAAGGGGGAYINDTAGNSDGSAMTLTVGAGGGRGEWGSSGKTNNGGNGGASSITYKGHTYYAGGGQGGHGVNMLVADENCNTIETCLGAGGRAKRDGIAINNGSNYIFGGTGLNPPNTDWSGAGGKGAGPRGGTGGASISGVSDGKPGSEFGGGAGGGNSDAWFKVAYGGDGANGMVEIRFTMDLNPPVLTANKLLLCASETATLTSTIDCEHSTALRQWQKKNASGGWDNITGYGKTMTTSGGIYRVRVQHNGMVGATPPQPGKTIYDCNGGAEITPTTGYSNEIEIIQQPTITTSNATINICSGDTLKYARTNIPGNAGIFPAGVTFTTQITTPNANILGAETAVAADSVNLGALVNTTNTVQTMVFKVTPIGTTCAVNPITITVNVKPVPKLDDIITQWVCDGYSLSFTPQNGIDGIIPNNIEYCIWQMDPSLPDGGYSSAICNSSVNLGPFTFNKTDLDKNQISYGIVPIYRTDDANEACNSSVRGSVLSIVVDSLPHIIASCDTVCEGANSVVFIIPPHCGKIGKWQYAASPFSTWTDINEDSDTLTIENIPETMQIRAVLDSGTPFKAVTIITKAKPVVSFTGPTTICAGNTTTLSPTSGGTWASNNPSVATVTNAGLVTGVGQGAVTFTYTRDGGCSASITP